MQTDATLIEAACEAFMGKITVDGNGGIEFLEEGIIAALTAYSAPQALKPNDLAAQMVREMQPVGSRHPSEVERLTAIARRYMEKLFSEDEIRRGTWELTDYINPDDIIREIRAERAGKDGR